MHLLFFCLRMSRGGGKTPPPTLRVGGISGNGMVPALAPAVTGIVMTSKLTFHMMNDFLIALHVQCSRLARPRMVGWQRRERKRIWENGGD